LGENFAEFLALEIPKKSGKSDDFFLKSFFVLIFLCSEKNMEKYFSEGKSFKEFQRNFFVGIFLERNFSFEKFKFFFGKLKRILYLSKIFKDPSNLESQIFFFRSFHIGETLMKFLF